MKGSKAEILVVDDEPGILELLTRLFENHGYQIDTAKNGSEALTLEKKKSHRLAFIDIIMPGRNGVETFLALKKINPEIRGIMITGYAVEDLIKEALACGVEACVNKPFRTKELFALSKKILMKK